MPPSDADLVLRVLHSDDRHAFAELLRRHQSLVRSLLRRLTCGDVALADDLAQETFLRAYRGLHRYRGGAKLSSWLYRIAYNVFLSHAQVGRRGSGAGDPEEAPMAPGGPEEAGPALAQALLRHDVERAMTCLSLKERAALALVYAEDLSHDEAAQILGWPLGTLKTHVARAKVKLRLYLSSWNDAAGGATGTGSTA